MPAISLYRKWRPQTFQELIGQDHITTTLTNAIRTNRIAHAYVFTGPRGTGKTTTARIFAKAISCTNDDEERRPCNVCEICVSINEDRNLDLIEIDAASNNGVDNVRDLRERVGFSPSQSRYKVYILDEAHMLSSGAFNALLKTLEEPPAHAIFVLATTEVDKLPGTVLSRCQRFDFRFVSFRLIREQLAKIAAAEGAQIEPGALDLFARQASGSLRDGISLLDQMIAYGNGRVTLKQAQTILGSVASQSVGALTNFIIARDVGSGLNLINQTIADGADPRQFLREMLEYLRGLLLLRASPDGQMLNLPAETIAEMKTQGAALPIAELLSVIKNFTQAANQLRNAPQPQLPIEVAFVESTLRGAGDATSESHQDSETAKVNAPAAQPAPARTQPQPRPAPVKPAAPQRAGHPSSSQPSSAAAVRPGATKPAARPSSPAPSKSQSTSAAGNPQFDALQQQWNDVLAAIKPKNRSLEAILKSGRLIALEERIVVLGFPYQFHKDKIEEPRSKQLLEEVLSEMLNKPMRVRCELVAAESKKQPLRPKDKNERAMEDPLVKEVVKKYNARIAHVEEDAEHDAGGEI